MMDEGLNFFRSWHPAEQGSRPRGEEWPRQMVEAHLHMSQALSYALELRDPAMRIAAHCARVAALSCHLAEEVGVSGAEMDALRQAAELHEIGIISVPHELLLRPAPLSPAELERVRAQAWVGAEVVRTMYSHLTALLIEHQYDDYIVLRQHGRLGERELLLAGILRVADVLDAVAVPRPYQRSLPPVARVELLRAGTALHFHPVAASVALHGMEAG